jgi:hypothetical protein
MVACFNRHMVIEWHGMRPILNKSKIHELSLYLSTWIKMVTVLRKYDPQVTEDMLHDFYGHLWV